MSQNQEAGSDGWRLGRGYSTPYRQGVDYHSLIINHANDMGVIVIHAKLERLFNTEYRNIVFRVMNGFSLADSRDSPFLGWVLRQLTRVDATGITYQTVIDFDFDCTAVDTYPEERTPPGSQP